MNSKTTIALLLICFALVSCQNSETVQIADNTFVYKNKVYKLIDNELTEVADLNAKQIRKLEVLKPQEKTLGTHTLSYISEGVTAKVNALYRGNYLYFKLNLEGINDLKDNYYPGSLTLEFVDEYGFLLHSTAISTGDLIGMVGSNGKIDHFEFSGKTEMSTEINKAITDFSVSSSIKRK